MKVKKKTKLKYKNKNSKFNFIQPIKHNLDKIKN